MIRLYATPSANRSTSMQNRGRGDDSDLTRIRHSRFDNSAPEAAHAFVMQQLRALPEGCVLESELDVDPSDLLTELVERGAGDRDRRTNPDGAG